MATTVQNIRATFTERTVAKSILQITALECAYNLEVRNHIEDNAFDIALLEEVHRGGRMFFFRFSNFLNLLEDFFSKMRLRASW